MFFLMNHLVGPASPTPSFPGAGGLLTAESDVSGGGNGAAPEGCNQMLLGREDVCLAVATFHLQHLAVFYERSLIRLLKAQGRHRHRRGAYVGAYVRRNGHGPISCAYVVTIFFHTISQSSFPRQVVELIA